MLYSIYIIDEVTFWPQLISKLLVTPIPAASDWPHTFLCSCLHAYLQVNFMTSYGHLGFSVASVCHLLYTQALIP